MSCWHLTVQVCPTKKTKKTISESVKWLVINNSAHMGQKQTNKQTKMLQSVGEEIMKIHH